MTADEPHWFAPIDAYVLDEPCPRCHAQPGALCTGRRPLGRYHAPRCDRAIAHYDRDVVTAPWLEDRRPGVSYSTLLTPKPTIDGVRASPL
ncbi:hypothetical protein AAIB33_06460 [Microbacterium sp. AZCO]|uniref:zinc finger domain-containing protein n=1 Tax=Microbacterium sp. AZCO TaxID=3142976 RepID=UPI0031F3D858